MATAKVTDDLLIARSDRHLGAVIVVALSVAFDCSDPPAASLARAASWCLQLPDLLCSSHPYLLCLCRLCFLSLHDVPRVLATCFPGVHTPMASFPPLLKAPETEPVFLSMKLLLSL